MFANTCKFSYHDIIKFILLLRKGVFPWMIGKNSMKKMSNAIFVKIVENVRKYGYTKLVTTDKQNNYLVSEQNYNHTRTFLFQKMY